MNRRAYAQRMLFAATVAAAAGSAVLAPPVGRILAAVLAVAAGAVLLGRMHGTCRACGHPGSWQDPLTLTRRPRVHTRHLQVIRESIRASRDGEQGTVAVPLVVAAALAVAAVLFLVAGGWAPAGMAAAGAVALASGGAARRTRGGAR